jgi:hypothetical protein
VPGESPGALPVAAGQVRQDRQHAEERRQRRGARAHVADRLGQDRVHGERDPGEQGAAARTEDPPRQRQHRERGEQVDEQIRRQVAVRVAAPDRPVQREGRHQHRPVQAVVRHGAERAGVGEEPRHVRERANGGVLLDVMGVVVVPVSRRGRDGEGEERAHHHDEGGLRPPVAWLRRVVAHSSTRSSLRSKRSWAICSEMRLSTKRITARKMSSWPKFVKRWNRT